MEALSAELVQKPSPLAKFVPEWAKRSRLWAFLWWIWFFTLFGLSSIPGHEMPKQPFRFFDKIEHFGYFFGGSVILGCWLILSGRWPQWWWLLPLSAAAVGTSDEVHQFYVPGRMCGVDDWVADTLGGFVAILVIRWIASRQLLSTP